MSDEPDENRAGRLSAAQVNRLRSKGRKGLRLAGVALFLVLPATVGFGYLIEGLWVGLVVGVMPVLLGAAGLHQFLCCLLDAGRPPAVVEGRIERKVERSRGREYRTLVVGDVCLPTPDETWAVSSTEKGRVYYGRLSRTLLAIEPLGPAASVSALTSP